MGNLHFQQLEDFIGTLNDPPKESSQNAELYKNHTKGGPFGRKEMTPGSKLSTQEEMDKW